MELAKQDMLTAAIEYFGHNGITIENGGSQIYVDDNSDPLEGRRLLTPTEDAEIRTAAQTIAAQREQAVFIKEVKTEVEKRIFDVASANAQMNMTAARADNALDSSQLQAYHDGRVWIASMTKKAGDLIASGDVDFKDDSKWPSCPQNVIELANLF